MRCVAMSRPYPLSTVRAFWDQVRLVGSPARAAVAVGVSMSAGLHWFAEAGGVKPCVSKPKLDGPKPRLSLRERVEIQVGVGRNESLRSLGRRLGKAGLNHQARTGQQRAQPLRRRVEVASVAIGHEADIIFGTIQRL
jgi:hypothetical protein